MRVLTIEHDPLVPPVGRFLAPVDDGQDGPLTVPVDAYRHHEVLIVQCDLPGVDPDSIEICLDGQALSLQAFRNFSPSPDDRVFLSERPGGVLYRSLDLPRDVDTTGALADFDGGVLTITIPLVDQVPARTRNDLPMPPASEGKNEPQVPFAPPPVALGPMSTPRTFGDDSAPRF